MPYQGSKSSEDITYSSEEKKGVITKVIARITGITSGRYTKLGRNLKKIEQLEKEIKVLKAEVKTDTKELIQDLFNADDIARTRVVETVGFLFELTKDPAVTVSVKYQKVLEEMEKHLTPELIVVLESIKTKFTTPASPKSPALSYVDKGGMNEASNGIVDKIKSFFSRFLKTTERWAVSYDNKLDALKAEISTVKEEFSEIKEDAIEYANAIVEKSVTDAADVYAKNMNESNAFDATVNHYISEIAHKTALSFEPWKRKLVEHVIKAELRKSGLVEIAVDKKL